MSSITCDFVDYAKKVWRPEIKTSSSIIHVVTNNRIKSYRKKMVDLKIADINLSSPNLFFNDFYEFRDFENETFSYGSHSSISDGSFKVSQNYAQVRCNSNQSLENQLEIRRKSTKTIRIVKRRLARKVYHEFSKCSESKNGDFYGKKAINTNKVDEKFNFSVARRTFLAKKYWNLWIKAVKNQLIEGDVSYLEKKTTAVSYISSKSTSSQSSANLNTRSNSNKRHNRIGNIDPNIIEAQKQKILEQEDQIKELQLMRLKLEGEKFAMETRQMLNESERHCDKKFQSKVRQLSVCHANDRPKLKVNKYKDGWDFVTRMEIRADERRKRWNAIGQRKQLLEQERLEKLRLEEEKRRQLEEEEKKRKIQQFRAEKERLADLKRKQEQERLYSNMLNSMAAEHYDKLLLRGSMNAFKNNLQQEKLMAEEADLHFRRKVTRRFFTLWRLFWKVEMRKKTDVADEFYEFLLLKNSFNRFKYVRLISVRNNQVAVDFNDLRIMKNYFIRWKMFVTRREFEMKKKENLAVEFLEMQTLRNAFYCWKQLPRILFLEREKEHRIRLWCNKVQELLPDFCPSYQCY